MRQQRADHLELHPVAKRQRRVRVPQLVRSEVEADLLLRALHDPIHIRVGQWPPDLAAPQVHEHEVTVHIAVLLVHVVVP